LLDSGEDFAPGANAVSLSRLRERDAERSEAGDEFPATCFLAALAALELDGVALEEI
jgi:hypothetical protein